MKILTKFPILLAALVFPSVVLSQAPVLVTATITAASNSAPYIYGSYQIQLVDANGNLIPGNGLPVSYSGSLNSSGVLSVSINPNSAFSSGSQWKFTICSQTPNLNLPITVQAQKCFSQAVTITGAGDISATLSASAPNIYYFNPVTGAIYANFPAGAGVNGQAISPSSVTTGTVAADAVLPKSITGIVYAAAYAAGSSTAGINEASAACPSTGCKIVLPCGSITTTAPIQLKNFSTYEGCGYGDAYGTGGGTLIANSTTDMFVPASTSVGIMYVDISGLYAFEGSTGGHIFNFNGSSTALVQGFDLHHSSFQQGNPAKSIITTTGVGEVLENNLHDIWASYAGNNSVPAFNLNPLIINNNQFSRIVTVTNFGSVGIGTWAFLLEATSSEAQVYGANRFQDIILENAAGGGMKILSVADTTLDNVGDIDITGSWTSPGIYFGKSATATYGGFRLHIVNNGGSGSCTGESQEAPDLQIGAAFSVVLENSSYCWIKSDSPESITLLGSSTVTNRKNIQAVQVSNGAITFLPDTTDAGGVNFNWWAGSVGYYDGSLNLDMGTHFRAFSFNSDGSIWLGSNWHTTLAGDNTANSYNGAGTGLTGTASNLTAGNATNAVNATNATNLSPVASPSGVQKVVMVGSATAPLINGCTNTIAGAGTTIACSLTTTINGALVVDVQFTRGAGLPTIALADSGTYDSIVQSIAGVQWNGTAAWDAVFTVVNAAAGAHTLTFTFGNSVTYSSIMALLAGKASTTTPIDATSSAVGSGVTTTCGSLTTTTDGELLVGFGHIANGSDTLAASSTPQVMALAQSADSSDANMFGYATSAGSHYAQFTNNSGAPSVCLLLAVK